MLQGCITGSGGRLTAAAIRRFKLFERGVADEEFFEGMDTLWKLKHGHSLTPRKPKAPKRVKTDADHKWCNGCEKVLSVKAFNVDRSRKTGLANRCRDCNAKAWKRVNHHLCKKCDGWCVGQICRRCFFVHRQISESGLAIQAHISGLLYADQIQRREEIKCLKQGKKTLQQIREILNS